MKRQIAPSSRYGSVSTETNNIRDAPQYLMCPEIVERERFNNPVVYFKRKGKPLSELDEPVQLIQSQEYLRNNERDNVQDWLNDQRKRSQTSRYQQHVECEENMIKNSQKMMRNRNIHKSNQDLSVLQQQLSKSNCFKKTQFTSSLNSEHKMRNQIIQQISSKQNIKKKKYDDIICSNCEQKRSKYHLVNNRNSELFFCSKCSIKLLQKGFQVEEIQEWEKAKLARAQNMISEFMSKLSQVHQTTVENMQEISNANLSSIDLERETIEQTYKQVYEVLERMRSKELNRLDEVEANLISERQKVHLKLLGQLDQIQTMNIKMRLASQNMMTTNPQQTERDVQQFTKQLMDFYSYKFIRKQAELDPHDIRLQKLLNNVYEQILVGQQSVQTSFTTMSPTLNFTDATIEQIRQPFRFLFPDDRDRENTRSRQYIQNIQRPNDHRH